MKRVLNLLWSGPEPNQKIETLEECLKRLTAKKVDVCTEIENAELRPGKKRREEVVHWLKNVETKTSEAQSFVNKDQQQRLIQSNSQLIGNIERVTKEVQDLIQQGEFPNGPVLDDHKTRALPFPETGMVGEMFQQNLEMVLGWLEVPESVLIGVHGMGGAGKTTLLKHIYNNLLKDHDIDSRVYWVTVANDCSLYMLQCKILKSVTDQKDFDEEDEGRRAALLHNVLGKMGKTVLFLDDLWKPFMLKEVGIPLGGNCCKVVLSSRSLDVCRQIGCPDGFIANVKPLSADESWGFFVEKLQNYEALPFEVKKIAKLVAKECCRLPLAIITISVSMRGVYDEPEWRDAFEELKNARHSGANEIFSRLKFSYDRLNDELMKQCFLSCVLFPEDFEIQRRDLLDLWITEGLLNGVESNREQLIIKGHAILNKLEKACLLESATQCGDRYVKMHDLIRDMGIYITQSYPRFMAKSGLQLKKAPEEELWSEDLVKVSLRDNEIEELPSDMSPKCPKLSVLMLGDNPLKVIPYPFFAHMSSLTVLDLSFTHIERSCQLMFPTCKI